MRSMWKMAACAAVIAAPFMIGNRAEAAVILTQGASGSVDLAGTVAGTSLSATASYNVTTFTSSSLVISFSLNNTTPSATPGQNRLISFGFDLVPVDNRTITGASANTATSGWGASTFANITNSTTVDICAWDGNNCSGGGNQGVGEGLTESFILTISGTFQQPLSMDNFTARYQSIGANGASGIIGEATPPTPVPEPATIALFGAALAGLGLGLRRRKRAA